MLKADKSRWFEKLFAVYNRNLLKRRFNSLRVDGLENLKAKSTRTPLIIYANHSSWWDGLAAHHISQTAQLDFFVMMEEKQLRNLKLFRKLGAFSVVRENPRQAVDSLNYAAKLLKSDSRRTLWIFPQGEILPNDTRPLDFFRGVLKIAAKAGECSIVSLAFRYEFLGAYKPDIFVKIGRIENLTAAAEKSSRTEVVKYADQLADQLDQIKSNILKNDLDKYLDIF